MKHLSALFALAFVVLLYTVPAPVGHGSALISSDLAATLETQGSAKAWVFFTDKGLHGADLREALVEAEASLPERTARRRAKVMPAEALADENDLPVSERYLARVAAAGAEIHRSSRWLNAASATVDQSVVDRLAALPEVVRLDLVRGLRSVEIPTPVTEDFPPLPAAKSAAGGLDYGANLAAMQQANVLPLHEQGLSGAGVVVGALDTGFRTLHESLDHLPVISAYDFVANDSYVDQEPEDPAGSRNHGTMVLSVMAGYTPGELIGPAYGTSVILARTEDIGQEVPAEEDDWVAGMEWVEFLGADIVNSSLGYNDWYDFASLDGETAVTTIAADLAVGRGLVVLNAVGNDRNSSGLMIAPADGDSVITVGGVDINDNLAPFSSPGPAGDGRIKPDVCALAVSNPLANPNDDTAYGTASGTSFATPLTSGVVALMLERVPALTPMQVREALRMTASQAGAPDNDFGWGIIDAWAAASYWGPVFAHDLLENTNDPVGPYTVEAVITDREGLDAATAHLVYRIDGGGWISAPLTPTGAADTFAADIPGQPVGTTVEYYLEATGLNGLSSALPARRATAAHAFAVEDWVAESYPSAGPEALPDGLGAGLQKVVEIPLVGSGPIVSVDVDFELTHPELSEVVVRLTGPDGTQVTLYDRDDLGVADLAGNWPETLTESGPGTLADFVGLRNEGTWTLTVGDVLTGNVGTLESWSLNFILAGQVSPVPETPVARVLDLRPNVPNPFNPRTEIRFELRKAGRTRLTIFDTRGMLVRRLVDADLGAGPHARTWDGRDDAGRSVTSGTYLYRLDSAGETQSRKMLLMR